MVRPLFLLLLLFFPAILFAQDIPESKSDSIAYAVVEALPEVKQLVREYRKDTTSHVFTMIKQSPDSTSGYYAITVGIDDSIMLHTFWWFYVNPKNWSVHYYDVASGSIISLKEWRARNKH